jgi:hypothetical protein
MGMLQNQNPGAVDVTSKEGAVDPNVQGAPATPSNGVAAARAAADDTPNADAPEEQASPEEQKEYERAMDAVSTVLYKNQGTSEAIADMLQPEDKISSVVQATMLTLHQIDAQLDLDETVIPQVMSDIADMVMDMGEQVKGMTFSDKEAQAVLGATWEATMQMYGVDEDAYHNFTSGLDDKKLSGYEQKYKEFLGD